MKENQRLKGVLFVLISFLLLTGCKGMPSKNAPENTSAANPAFKDKMEISVALWNIENALSQTENDQFYQHLRDKFNIDIRPVSLNWDDYAQKIILWASTGDLPDIFSIDAVGTGYYRDWIKRGLIKPLPEKLDRYPTLNQYIQDEDLGDLREDGKLYFIPRRLYESIKYCVHDRNVFYRWDLAREAGITREPETWDEFDQMLKAIIEADPENKKVQGMTLVNLKHISGFFWLYSNPAAASDGSGNDYKWINEGGRFIPAVFSQKSTASLIHLRNMYTGGLIDREAISNKGTQGYEKFATGQASAILMKGYGTLDTMVLKKWKEVYPDKELTDCIKRAGNFPALDGNSYQSAFKTFWSESYFSGAVSDEKLDRILGLYDYMLTDQAKEFYRFGIKDIDYKKDGERIIPITSPGELDKKQHSGPVLGSLVEYDDQFQYDPNNFTLDSKIREMAAKDIEFDMKHTALPDYEARLTYLSTPAKDSFAVYDYEDMVRVMLSEEPVETVWNQIIRDYEAKGLDKVIEEVNERAKELGIE